MNILLAFSSCLTSLAFGQADVPPAPAPSVVECRICHTSDSPTKEKPSLVKCPRARTKGVHSLAEAPESFTLGTPGAKYGPVKFAHKAHAKMAEMGGGCYLCHHYDQGGPIQKCADCHAAERFREDLGKPDLKGAMHRLCVECHRTWGHSTECATCHGNKPGPKTAMPKQVVYQTSSDKGRYATFPHSDHAQRFGLRCAECHQQQTCVSCHDALKVQGAPPPRADSPKSHPSCFKCHGKDKCSSCHSAEPKGAFDHGKSTGWVHNRFHKSLECARCHTTPGKFAKIAADCESCHKGWQAKFDHKKTGLALNEIHAALGCADCHTPTFSGPPACGNCHDKSYPKDSPGPAGKKKK